MARIINIMAKQIGILTGVTRIRNSALKAFDGEVEIISPNNSMRGENGNWILRATATGMDIIKIKGGSEIIVDQLNT